MRVLIPKRFTSKKVTDFLFFGHRPCAEKSGILSDPALKGRNESDVFDQTETMIVFETFQSCTKEVKLFAGTAAGTGSARTAPSAVTTAAASCGTGRSGAVASTHLSAFRALKTFSLLDRAAVIRRQALGAGCS